MSERINIHQSETIINLQPGIYPVYALGGWNVTVGKFSFSAENVRNGNVIYPRKVILRTQAYEYGKRTKKIFTLDIPEWSDYKICFENISDLKVKKARLFMPYLWDSLIPNEMTEISF